MNISGFLKWQFAGWYKDLTLWGGVIAVLGAVALYQGCPAPIPYFILAAGWGLIFFDMGRAYFRFSYSLYRLQQTQVINELKRKEQ